MYLRHFLAKYWFIREIMNRLRTVKYPNGTQMVFKTEYEDTHKIPCL